MELKTDMRVEKQDIPELLLQSTAARFAKARISTTEAGIIFGIDEVREKAQTLGLECILAVINGQRCDAGGIVADFYGHVIDLVKAENEMLGLLMKPSGVATAAKQALEKAGHIKVVCGGWKKVLPGDKEILRRAVESVGMETRLTAQPFLYLDKNYVRAVGSIDGILGETYKFPERNIAIQVKGETNSIEKEALLAAANGAHIIMVDTGSVDDFRKCSRILSQEGVRENVKLTLSGGIVIEDLESLQGYDIDIIDMGRAVLDAPLLDMRYDVFPM